MTVYSRSLRAASALRFAPSRAIRNLRSRRHAVHRWKDWAARELVARPIWIHGASVGELLAAEPVTRRLKRSLPNTPIIYTHGSDSVEGWYDRLSADRT
ncbi:MAG: glycosyltransferase N-terminal domain-containing protein, partial [Gemmatimonadales bacterium]